MSFCIHIQEITADIQRRLCSAQTLLKNKESQNSLASHKSPSPLPVCSGRKKSAERMEEPPSTEKKPQIPPTRKTLQSHQKQMKKPMAEKTPKSQPPSLPNSSKSRKTQYLRQQNPSKAASGAKPQLSPSCHVRASRPQCPLAPMFLKSYRKKKKKSSAPERSISADGRKNEKAPRRYPERKRKKITDDCHVVSDDATLSDVLESRKKIARIK